MVALFLAAASMLPQASPKPDHFCVRNATVRVEPGERSDRGNGRLDRFEVVHIFLSDNGLVSIYDGDFHFLETSREKLVERSGVMLYRLTNEYGFGGYLAVGADGATSLFTGSVFKGGSSDLAWFDRVNFGPCVWDGTPTPPIKVSPTARIGPTKARRR